MNLYHNIMNSSLQMVRWIIKQNATNHFNQSLDYKLFSRFFNSSLSSLRSKRNFLNFNMERDKELKRQPNASSIRSRGFSSINFAKYRIIVICGPSGSGKTTLIQMLHQEFDSHLKFCVSHTTRKMRTDEEEGRSYYYIDRLTFEEMIANNEFVEYSMFSGNYYGTSYKELIDHENSNQVSLLDVDIRGVINLKKNNLNAKFIFIRPPSMEFLNANLMKRGTENLETINTRLEHALEDMRIAEQVRFDLVIENIDLKKSYEILREFFKKHMLRRIPEDKLR
ncbi:Guanylate kinase [Sarcoptes scabiei]|nr:Guanylate kinase [Sarcoptes scabiei]UXI15782.1 putative transport protein [Sarcoptes scabiei]